MGKLLDDGTRVARGNAPRDVDPFVDPFVATVADATVAEVKDRVDAGEWDVDDVVAAEQRGKQRATVLNLGG